MALIWDTTNIKDGETVCFYRATVAVPDRFVEVGDRCLNAVTNALIWASLSTGVGTITEENAAEVYARINLIEKLFGPMLIRAEVDGKRPKGEKSFITIEEVQVHIGLHTNASFRDESRASFLKRNVTAELNDNVNRFKRETAKVEA